MTDETVDYYEILQISPNAEPDTIHRVYRLLAQRLHPDNAATGNEVQFRALSEAYQVLSNPEQRARYDVSYESALRSAGYRVTVVPNQGKGAAKARIEAARRLFPAMWFNAATTEGGREALGSYHEKKDAVRNIGLGPEHDWSSHGADSFGLGCIAYEEQTFQEDDYEDDDYTGRSDVGGY